MNILTQASSQQRGGSCVVALHCSLGSGRQWTKLAAALGPDTKLIAPDLAGYGNNPRAFDLPTTLSAEVESLSEHLRDATGPIHLVGHSYGGAIAFKIATASPFADRVRWRAPTLAIMYQKVVITGQLGAAH